MRATSYPDPWRLHWASQPSTLRDDLMKLQDGNAIDPDTRWGPAARVVRVLFAASTEELVIEGLTSTHPELLGRKLIQNFSQDAAFAPALAFACGDCPYRLLLVLLVLS